MANRYPGTCSCGAKVAAGEGVSVTIRHRWHVRCLPCYDAPPAAAVPRVNQPPLRCEGCGATFAPGAPGAGRTSDGCDICPECWPGLMADWDALSDEERTRYA